MFFSDVKRFFWGGLFTAVLATSLFFTGCAHIPKPSSVESPFPEEFSLTQVVTVQDGKGEKQSFIASLSRQRDDLQVAMLDPIFMTPLYVAHLSAGQLVEDKPLPKQAKGLGEMLVRELSELFGSTSFELVTKAVGTPDGGTGAAQEERLVVQTRRFHFEMPQFSGPSECPFPSDIWMRTKGGMELSVLATTEDVSCHAVP